MSITKLYAGVVGDPLNTTGPALAASVNQLIDTHVSHLKALPTAANAQTDTVYSVAGFYVGSVVGGGQFIYDPTKSKSLHNGGTVISPEAILAWDGTQASLATLLNWTGSGSGCWIRLLDGFVTPEMFGAVGSGSVDDWLAMQKTFSQRKPIELARATYAISDELTLYHPYKVTGVGQEITKLLFTGLTGYTGKNGINVICEGVPDASGVMSDFTLVAASGNGNSAIRTPRGMAPTYPTRSIYSVHSPRYYFERMSFRGITPQDPDLPSFGRYLECWNKGINLGDAREPSFRDLYFMGNFNKNSMLNTDIHPDCTTAAIHLEGTLIGVDGATANGAIVSSLIDHVFVYYYGTGVRYKQRCNQVNIETCHLNTCWIGIEAKRPYSGYAATEVYINSMQIQTQRAGLIFEDGGWVNMTDIRSSKTGGADVGISWYGYFFDGVGYPSLENCRSYGNSAGSADDYLIYAKNSDWLKLSNVILFGSSISAADYGLYMVDSMYSQLNNVSFNTIGTGVYFGTSGASAYNVASKMTNIMWSNVNQRFDNAALVGTKLVQASDSMQQTFTPTVTAVSNVTTVTAGTGAVSRSGDIVSGTLVITIDPTTINTDCIVDVSIPIDSDFAASSDAGGVMCEVDSGKNSAAMLYAETSGNKIRMRFYALDISNRVWRGNFSYIVK
jgi:hypothetical protein